MTAIRRCVAALAFLLPGVLGLVSAQDGIPGPRSCLSTAYSPRQAGVLVFGGARVCGRDVLADSALWHWSGTAWRRVANGQFPGAREDALVIFDERRDVLVLYGGRNAGTVFADTWEWDGTRWGSVAVTGPGQVEHASMAYDPARGRTVLFGGGSRGRPWPRSTWEWDGTRWLLGDSTGPVPRVGHSMASTPLTGGVLLYGGFNESGPLRDLWRWDGRRWSLLDSLGPAHSEGNALVAYSGDSVALVSAQPVDAPAGRYRVWVWAGDRWSERGDPGPASRTGPGIVFDPVRRRIVLVGGALAGAAQSSADAWEFDGTAWYRSP